MHNNLNLKELTQRCLQVTQPSRWGPVIAKTASSQPCLFIGKAAAATAEVIAPQTPYNLMITDHLPQKAFRGEVVLGAHPFPGPGSFQAGERLLDFFSLLNREGQTRLRIFLSGGASSLMWLRPFGLSEEELIARLHKLYSRPISIETLNRERSKLCILKNGGAGHWLNRLAPRVKATAHLISDVLPYGPRVVGSGPFWTGKIPHFVVASGKQWVDEIARELRRRDYKIALKQQGVVVSWEKWVKLACTEARRCLAGKNPAAIIMGGEPAIGLGKKSGSGGRQTHLAIGLLRELSSEIQLGRVEILCMSSDGKDGNSGASGAWLTPKALRSSLQSTGHEKFQTQLGQSLARLNAAEFLARQRMLLPDQDPLTNVQDVMVLLVRPWEHLPF